MAEREALCKTTVRMYGEERLLTFYAGTYHEGGTAIRATFLDKESGTEKPFAVLSAWLPDTPLLEEDQFFAEDCGETEELYAHMIAEELIEETGLFGKRGWMFFPVCRFTKKAKETLNDTSQ